MLIVPITVVIMLLLVQGALYYLGRAVATNAAEDGARAAAVVGGSTSSGEQAATNELNQVGSGFFHTENVSSSATATSVEVTVTGHVEAILPFMSIPVRTSATANLEQFQP